MIRKVGWLKSKPSSEKEADKEGKQNETHISVCGAFLINVGVKKGLQKSPLLREGGFQCAFAPALVTQSKSSKTASSSEADHDPEGAESGSSTSAACKSGIQRGRLPKGRLCRLPTTPQQSLSSGFFLKCDGLYIAEGTVNSDELLGSCVLRRGAREKKAPEPCRGVREEASSGRQSVVFVKLPRNPRQVAEELRCHLPSPNIGAVL